VALQKAGKVVLAIPIVVAVVHLAEELLL